MTRLDIVVIGLEATRALARIAQNVDDSEVALHAVADQIRQRNERFFDTRGTGTWDPNDVITVAIKGASTVLVDRGVLKRSLTKPGARYADHKVTATTVEVSTKDPVANYMRTGARGRPRRDPTGKPSAADVERWASTILDVIAVLE